MSFAITNRAFRFEFGGVQYAIDVFNEGLVIAEPAVHLFYMAEEGWYRAHAEMEPPLIVRQADIDNAGGVVKLCQIIVEKINKALRILHGGAVGDDIPPGTLPHEVVADYLRAHLSLTVVDGVPVLELGA